jgi:hypothetical protein
LKIIQFVQSLRCRYRIVQRTAIPQRKCRTGDRVRAMDSVFDCCIARQIGTIRVAVSFTVSTSKHNRIPTDDVPRQKKYRCRQMSDTTNLLAFHRSVLSPRSEAKSNSPDSSAARWRLSPDCCRYRRLFTSSSFRFDVKVMGGHSIKHERNNNRYGSVG